MQLATDVGPRPMHVGAVLVLGTSAAFSVTDAQRLLAGRISGVPRLRQRLRRAPPGCGRPFWADDPAFGVRRHVQSRPCPAPGDERALLDVAAALFRVPLPRSRPLWSATFVTGLEDGGTGLVVVMHHVLADGIGGLAVLAGLVDQPPGLASAPPRRAPGSADPQPAGLPVPATADPRPAGFPDLATADPQPAAFPVPAPGLGTLAADAWAGRLRGLAHLAGRARTARRGLAELGGARPPRRFPATSLNRPTGPARRLDVVTADLAAVRELGHACGGTVNDVVLAAVAGALRALLASRGEELGLVTISVPVSGRRAATAGQLGNQVGVMLVTIPAGGRLADRVSRAAAVTHARKAAARGTSAALLGPLFRGLARSGLLRVFVNRQRMVHTFATNLRGPAAPLTFGGAPVRAVIPVPSTTGNVTVTFAVLSYAGVLRITVLSDPGRMPDVAVLAAALRRDLGGAGCAEPAG